MPKGTIRNTQVIHQAELDNTINIHGTLNAIDSEGDPDVNPPYEVNFVSSRPVSMGDRVSFRVRRVGDNIVAIID